MAITTSPTFFEIRSLDRQLNLNIFSVYLDASRILNKRSQS